MPPWNVRPKSGHSYENEELLSDLQSSVRAASHIHSLGIAGDYEQA